MQSAEVELKGKTTVPDAVDKSKKSMVTFEKQVEDIQKKFSTAFKDIFLGFTAPMVIIQNVIGAISDAVAKAKQDAKDGLDLMAQGETTFATTEEKKTAAYFKQKLERESEEKKVNLGKAMTVEEYSKTERGKIAVEDFVKNNRGLMISGIIAQGGVRRAAMIDPSFMKYMIDDFIRSPEGKSAIGLGSKDFKGPEGISNVIGVGPSPMLAAMNEQTDIARQQLAELQRINGKEPAVPTDFTKESK